MQAGGDEHGDAFPRHPRRQHAFDQRAQEQMVGDRPRDVADQDARRCAMPGEISESDPGGGLLEGPLQLRRGVRQDRHRLLADLRDLEMVGKLYGKLAAAVQQFNFHFPPRADSLLN